MSTLTTIGIVAALALLIGLPGIPAAILISGKRTLRIAPTIVLGLFVGLGITLSVVVLLVHLGAYTAPVLVGSIVLISIPLWLRVKATRPSFAPAAVSPPAIAMGAILAGALVLRTDPIYFIYETADFGGYINIANQLAGGGSFGVWFLDLFPAALSLPALLFGSAHTVALMPLLGLLLIVGLAAVSRALGFSPWTTATVAFLTAFHIVPVWFSEFPASETLAAVLLVGLTLLLATAIRTHSTAMAYAAGVFGFFLAISRVNSLLLAPVIVIATIAGMAVLTKQDARIAKRFLFVFYASTVVGFFYDVTYSPRYFTFQLDLFFPTSMSSAAAELTNPLLTIVLAVVVGAIGYGAVALVRRLSTRQAVAWKLSVTAAVGVVIGLIAWVSSRALSGNYDGPGGKVMILGFLLLGLALAGAVIGALDLRRAGGERQVTFWIALLTGVAFVALQATRLDQPANDVAPYFLYWHRYYLSEVFPAAIILSCWSLDWLATTAAKLVAAERLRKFMPTAVAVVVMAVVAVEALGPNVRVASGTMFEDAYETIAELNELTSEPPDAPIIYIGSNDLPPGWFWPNTARLIAAPLQTSFGRTVVGNLGPREPDLEPTGKQLIDIAEGQGVDTVFVITDYPPIEDPSVLDTTGWAIEEVGSVATTIDRLQWEPATKTKDQIYATTTLHLTVYELTR